MEYNFLISGLLIWQKIAFQKRSYHSKMEWWTISMINNNNTFYMIQKFPAFI